MAVKKDETTGLWMYYGSYKTKNGTRRQYKKRGFEKKKDAIKAEVLFKERINGSMSDMTVNELIDAYQKYSENRIKDGTYYTQNTQYLIWRDLIGNIQLSKLTTNDVQNCLNDLLSKYKFSTVQEYYMRLKTAMKYAEKQGYISENVCKRVDLKKNPNEKKDEINFWTLDQFNTFINDIHSMTFHLLFMNQFYMGMRIGEALALQWKDIDFVKNTITINKTWNGTQKKLTTPKTNNSYRTITMPKFLSDEYKAMKDKLNVPDEAFVFGVDKPYSFPTVRNFLKSNIARINSKLDEAHQLPHITTHDLRHSNASYLINNMVKNDVANFSAYNIAKRLGDNLDTVLSVYAHWLPQADKDIADFMDKEKQN